jgi:hypothetical protein
VCNLLTTTPKNLMNMESAIIAAITSLIISTFSVYLSFRNQIQQKEQFDKNQKRALTNKLYELRLENYPKAFSITEWLQKSKGNNLDPKNALKVLEDLKEWKTGTISLIMSKVSVDKFYELRDALSKQPALGNSYSNEQIEKIWILRNQFRRSLRKDIGLLYEEENSN